MKKALGKLKKWARPSELGNNSIKMELMLSKRRTKIPAFKKPRLEGIRLQTPERAKYLGMILDPKLSWKQNITEKVRKASKTFFACRTKFGQNWGSHLKIIMWHNNRKAYYSRKQH